MNGHLVSSSSHIIIFLGMALEAFIADVAATGAVAGENGDVDGNRAIEVTDAIYLLEWLFRSGPEPVPCAEREESRGLPDTGQTTCFVPAPPRFFGEEVPWDHPGACPGQDGATETGCPSDDRFNQRPREHRRPSGAEEGEAACRGRRGGGSASPTSTEAKSLSDSCSGSE